MKRIVLEIRQSVSGLWHVKISTFFGDSPEEALSVELSFSKQSDAQAYALWITSEELTLLPAPEIDFKRLTEIGKELNP